MKMNLLLVVLLTCSLSAAQPPRPDPLDENLFPPELIMQNADEINLSDEQREKLEDEMRKAHERFADMHADRERRVEAMNALLKNPRVNESAALAQFDKVLEKEQEIRRAHLAFVIGLKNKLTPEQQTKLMDIKKRLPRVAADHRPNPGRPPPASLQEKMKKFKAGVKKLEDEGGDASSVGELMREFKPLMDEQKYKQAEEVIDQALKALREQK